MRGFSMSTEPKCVRQKRLQSARAKKESLKRIGALLPTNPIKDRKKWQAGLASLMFGAAKP